MPWWGWTFLHLTSKELRVEVHFGLTEFWSTTFRQYLVSHFFYSKELANQPLNKNKNQKTKKTNFIDFISTVLGEPFFYNKELANQPLNKNKNQKTKKKNKFHWFRSKPLIFLHITFLAAKIPTAMAAIFAGMDEWSRKTCIRFRKRTTERDYAYFKYGSE